MFYIYFYYYILIDKFCKKILDLSSGKELGAFAVGELFIKSPANTPGYLTPENEVTIN